MEYWFLRIPLVRVRHTRDERMTHPIAPRAHIRLAMLVAIPVVSALAVYYVAADARTENDWVKHTLLVQLSLERLISDLQGAEAGERGFLITNGEQYLEPYKTAVAQARQDVTTIRKLTSDNVRQQRELEQMQPLVDAKLDDMEKIVKSHRAGLKAPAEVHRIDQARAVMDSIRTLSGGMRREEERLLRERELGLSQATRRLSWCLAMGYVLGIVVVVSLYRSAQRYGLQVSDAQQKLSQLNAELERRVRDRTASLQASQELLKLFVKHVPAATAMFDREMRYLQVSDRWCSDYSLTGSEILGRSHYEVFPDLPEHWKELHRRGLAGQNLSDDDARWERSSGESMRLRWEIRPWGDREGTAHGILIFTEDITARKRIEEELRESDATTRTLLETAAQAILTVSADGIIVSANRMAEEMFGYPHNELIGSPIEMLMPPALRDRHAGHRADFHSNPQRRPMGIGLELRGLRKSGSEFPLEISLSSVDTKRGRLAVGFVTDITLRKQAEKTLRNTEIELRQLAASLLTASEDERRRLARELHDDVTQRLAFLSIEIGKAVHLPAEETRMRLPALQQQVIRISDEVRRLSHGLHPSIIEDLGLSSAVEELCEEFSAAHEIGIRFDGPIDETGLSRNVAACLFRIAQEAIGNASKHARATEVHVSLSSYSGNIQLLVSDNGTGFARQLSHSHFGLGIVSMKERMRLVNGTLSITSRIDQGTDILASAPLSGVDREKAANSAG